MAANSSASMDAALVHIKTFLGELGNWLRLFAGLIISAMMVAVPAKMMG